MYTLFTFFLYVFGTLGDSFTPCIGTVAGTKPVIKVMSAGRLGWVISSAVHSDGTLLFSSHSTCIYRMDDSGVPICYAGNSSDTSFWTPSGGFDLASSMVTTIPTRVAVGPDGLAYFCDLKIAACFKVLPNGQLVHVAGQVYNGDGYSGGSPQEKGLGGPATLVRFAGWSPWDIVWDTHGDFYIADTYSFTVLKVTVSTGIITLYAGTFRVAGYTGDGGPALNATFSNEGMWGLAVNPFDNDLFIADTWNYAVRRVSYATGIITSVVGNSGFLGGWSNKRPTLPTPAAVGVGGPARLAFIKTVRDITIGPAPHYDLYFPDDSSYHVVWKVRPLQTPGGLDYANGTLQIAAGVFRVKGYNGDGLATRTMINAPWGITTTPSGHILLSDSDNGLIRLLNVTSGNMSTLAGLPPEEAAEKTTKNLAVNAELGNPLSAAFLSNGNVVLFDNYLQLLDRITGKLTVLAGNCIMGCAPGNKEAPGPLTTFGQGGVCVDSDDNVFITDRSGYLIRKYSFATGNVTPIAGNTSVSRVVYDPASENAPALSFSINQPMGCVVNGSTLYFSNYRFGRVTAVNLTSGLMRTVAGNSPLGRDQPAGRDGIPGPAVNASFSLPTQFALWNGDLFFSDEGHSAVYRIDSVTGMVSLFLGVPRSSATPNLGLPANMTSIAGLWGIAFDKSGNLFVGCIGAILMWNRSTERVSLVAGSLTTQGYEDGAAVSALLTNVMGLAFDPNGNLLFADNTNKMFRILHLNPKAPVLCPPGFFCSCNSNPSPCTSKHTFCPGNTSAAFPVSEGYAASSFLTPDNQLVYISQAHCPAGTYCSGGEKKMCRAGSYGANKGQVFTSSCFSCPTDSFSALSGGHIDAHSGALPCTSCPPGTQSSAVPLTCAFCSPGMYRSTNNFNCVPCPPTTFSLFGATICFPFLSSDGSAIVGERIVFQRNKKVDLALLTFDELFSVARIPLSLIGGISIAVILIATVASKASNGTLLARLDVFKRLDLFSVKPDARGVLRVAPQSLGGVFSAAGSVTMATLIVFTIYQYFYSNDLLVESVLPLSLTLLSATAPVPRATTQLGQQHYYHHNVSTGLFISITALGPRCGFLNSSSSLFYGNFSTSSAISSNLLATHTFSTAGMLDGQSFLRVSIDRSCQNIAVEVTAVGCGGGMSTVSFLAHNDNTNVLTSFEVTVPILLELVQDLMVPVGPYALAVSGRSTVGFTPIAAGDPTPTYGDIEKDYDGVLLLTIALPLQATYKATVIQPIMTPVLLLSAIFAYGSVLGLFGTVYGLLPCSKSAAAAGRKVEALGVAAPHKPASCPHEPLALNAPGFIAGSVGGITTATAGNLPQRGLSEPCEAEEAAPAAEQRKRHAEELI